MFCLKNKTGDFVHQLSQPLPENFYNWITERACVNVSISIRFFSDKSLCEANNTSVYESVYMSEW